MHELKELLPSVLEGLQTKEKVARRKLAEHWQSIAGPKIAPHTKPTLSEDGWLRVWVDQSALAYEINQRYRQALLKRAQAVLGEESVKRIAVRVGQLR